LFLISRELSLYRGFWVLSREETVRRAKGYAEEGFLCSESVLMALADCLGVSSELIPRVATGFSAGIGRSGEVCGAVSGAVLGLGLCFGRSKPGLGQEPKPHWYSRKLVDGFREKYGHVRCGDLLGLDISREEDYKAYRERGLWATACREYIATAAGISYDIMQKKLGK
jgi:C_GCAxxG_C_C family probable redox protein